MSILKEAKKNCIAIRFLDRDKSLHFYTEVLGFVNLGEENAEAYLGIHGDTDTRFIIEESPANRTRAVVGAKKLHVFSISLETQEQVLDVLYELNRDNHPIEFAHKNGENIGFVTQDPEGNRLHLHYTKDASLSKEKVEVATLLSTYTATKERPLWHQEVYIDYVKLNVPDLSTAKAFYEDIFQVTFNDQNEAKIIEGSHPFTIAFTEREGEDLIGNVDKLWDLEFIEVSVENTEKNAEYLSYLEEKEVPYFVDRKQKILTIKDTSGIEWWFTAK